MNAPEKLPELQGSNNQLESGFFPLSPEQVERGKALWGEEASHERLQALQRVHIYALKVIGTLRNSGGLAQRYLASILGAFSQFEGLSYDTGIDLDTLSIDDFEGIKDDLWQLIEQIFPDDNVEKGYPYAVGYFVNSTVEEAGKYRFTLGMLHSWKILGKDHVLFGKIPADVNLYGEALDIWSRYIYEKKGGIRYAYCIAMGNNGKTKVTRMPWELKPEDTLPPIFSSIGERLPELGKPAPEDDIRYLEDMYVLFFDGEEESEVPYPKLLYGFLKKHKDYFLANIEGRCIWKLGRNYLVKLRNEGAILSETKRRATPTGKLKKERKPPLKSHGHTSPVSMVISPVSSSESASKKTFTSPVVLSAFTYILSGGALYTKTARATVSSFPSESRLWVRDLGNPTDWKSYGPDDLISIDPIHSETQFEFCFAEETHGGSEPPEDKKQHPRTELTVGLRSSPKLVQIGTGTEGVTTSTTAQVTGALASLSSPDTTPDNDRTDEVGIEILGIIERLPEGVILTRENPLVSTISGVFQVNPAIHFIIDLSSATLVLGPQDVAGVDISRLQTELASVLPKLREFASNETDSYFLSQYSDMRYKLSHMIGVLVEDREDVEDREAITASDILEECQIYGRYGGDIFMSKLQRGKFEALRTFFAREGVDITLIDNSPNPGKNYSLGVKITVGIGERVEFRVSQTSLSPYYIIQAVGRGFSGRIDRFFRSISLDIYLFLALLGNEIFLSLPGAPTSRRRNLSNEQIEKILIGEYIFLRRSPPILSESDKTLIKQAALRVKNGLVKVSRGLVTQPEIGLMLPTISTARGITDFNKLDELEEVVLTDTKFNCIDEEQARKMEDQWGKKSGHPYSATYAILRYHERSRKYLIRRMIATIKGGDSSLSPFSNRMKSYFDGFWKTVPEETKKEFLKSTSGEGGHTGKGLTTRLPGGRILIDVFIEGADNGKIPFLYSKPKTLPKSTILEYINTEEFKMWLAELEKERPNPLLLMGK